MISMIEEKTGMIIVDTNNSNEAAELNLNHFREIMDKPVSAIMFTHSHYNYTSGTARFVQEAVSEDIEIWAHQDHVPNMLESYTQFYPRAYRRNIINNGVLSPKDGELGTVDCGLGGVYI